MVELIATTNSQIHEANTQLVDLRHKVGVAQADVSAERDKVAALQSEKASVEQALITLRADKARHEDAARKIEQDRAALGVERSTHKRSAELLGRVFESEQHAQIVGQTLEVFAPGQTDGSPAEAIDTSNLAPWVAPLVKAYEGMNVCRAHYEEAERRLMARYADLAKLYPERTAEFTKKKQEDKTELAKMQEAYWTRNEAGSLNDLSR